MRRAILLLASLLVILTGTEWSLDQVMPKIEPPIRWYKGNTHTHTLNSDGDSSPWEVAEWYKDHGYDFVVITDHNFLTSVERLNAVYGKKNDFLVIKGIEVSSRIGDKRVHLCALNPDHAISAAEDPAILNCLQSNVDRIRAANSVPIIAHPNHRWSFGTKELTLTENYRLFEIFNGHPYINNMGWDAHQSTEEIWDLVLSSGKILYGVAADDSHVFRDPWIRTKAKPNEGWVMVEADNLSAEAITGALEKGKFYSSTGIELEDYAADNEAVMVRVNQDKYAGYRFRFIGKNGQIFLETFDNPAVYRFKGDEMYIRVKIDDTNGNQAWIQPVHVRGK